MTHKYGTKSKVLVVHTVKAYADGIDKDLKELLDKSIQYAPYKHTNSTQRMVSMHANELTNIKLRYEVLKDVEVR